LILFLWLIVEMPTYTVDTVRVLGTRLAPGLGGVLSSVFVLDSAWLDRAPGPFVENAIGLVPGFWMRARGLAGVQADLGAGPGNYTQTAVLLNGVRLDDSQTAHHLFDLPLGLCELGRVEVARGGSSGLAGPGASCGAVNLLTGEPVNGQEAGAFAGSFGTALGFAEAGNGKLGLGLAGARSDGYRPGSDYTRWSVSSRGELVGANFFAGYSQKGFGARDFYAPYPSREWTSCGVLTANWQGFSIGARRHRDRFVLVEDDPSIYENNHLKTFLLCSWGTGLGPGFAGAEASWWELNSDRLGYHQAPGAGLFYQASLGVLALGLREDWRQGSGFATSVNAGLVMGTGRARGRLVLSSATRFPSATEMFYDDPGNAGNLDLRPERVDRAELGVSGRGFEASLFGTWFHQLIDWVKQGDGPWQATNLNGVHASGASAGFTNRWLIAGYAFCKTWGAEDIVSKYALVSPTNSVKLGTPWFFLSWEDGVCLASCRLSWGKGPLRLSFLGDNLLNQSYEPVPGLPGPGRSLGVELRWSGTRAREIVP